MSALRDLLNPERLTAIVDVGANPIDGKPPYQAMLEEGLCSVVGFEPQPDALAMLNVRKGATETYLPYVIGDGSEQTLHLCWAPGMTSLLKPDAHMMGLFGFTDWGRVQQEMPTPTVRLDDITEVSHIDLLKMDVQGSELTVLRSGKDKLSNAVAVMTEVSFMTLYEGQPTFGQIDTELRSRGFVPHCFVEAKVWPIQTGFAPSGDPHQLLEADMLYVRDFSRAMQPEQWKQLALIAHHVCASHDLAMHCIAILSRLGALPETAVTQYQSLLEAA